MKNRSKRLRWLVIPGGILGGIILLFFLGLVLVLIQRPLSGEVLEEPPPRASIQSFPVINRTQFHFDPDAPPKSLHDFARIVSAKQIDEGTRSYLTLMDHIETTKFYDRFCWLQINYPEPDNDYDLECLQKLSQLNETLLLLHGMIDAGGPVFPADEDLIALGRTGFPNDWRAELFFTVMANFLCGDMRSQFEKGDRAKATESTIYLIKYMAILQRGPYPSCGQPLFLATRNLFINLEYWLRRCSLNSSQAAQIARALDELESPASYNLRTEDTLYRARRKSYIAAINGGPRRSYRAAMYLRAMEDELLFRADQPTGGPGPLSWPDLVDRRAMNFSSVLQLKVKGQSMLKDFDAYWQHRLAFIEKQQAPVNGPENLYPTIPPGYDKLLRSFNPSMTYLRYEQTEIEIYKAAMIEIAGYQPTAQAPIDYFSGKPFFQRREGDQIIIWSVGKNGLDDGGPTRAWNAALVPFSEDESKTTDDLGISVLVPISQR